MARDRQRAKQRRRRQDAGGAAARSAARPRKARDIGLDDATTPTTPASASRRRTPRPIRSSTPPPTSTRPSSPRPAPVPPRSATPTASYDGDYDELRRRPSARPTRPRRTLPSSRPTPSAHEPPRAQAARPRPHLPPALRRRAAARPVARPPPGRPGHRRRPRLRRPRRRLPRSAGRALEADHRRHPLAPSDQGIHVSLVRHQHLLRAREQGQAEPRAPRLLARPAARRAPGRRADGDRPGDEGQPEDLRREAHHARLRAGQHGPQRGLLAGRQGHARA